MDPDEERRRILQLFDELGVDPSQVPDDLNVANGLASDVVIARNDKYTLKGVADAAGIDWETLAQTFTHVGIRADDPDEVLFGDADVELAHFLEAAITNILTEEEGVEMLHVASAAMTMLAEAAVASHIQGPEQRALDAVEAVRINIVTAELGIQLSSQLATTFRHHLRQAIRVNRRTQSYEHPELVTLAIGFLDLVGFTSMSQDMAVEDLVDLVKGFESRAHELGHVHDTRIVKLIGDEVMFVAENPARAASFAIDMIETLEEDSVIPRGGIAYGDLVNIHGDYFGPVVNLAARLVDSAIPGDVLVDDSMARAVDAEAAGRRMLKGFDDPVQVHSLNLKR